MTTSSLGMQAGQASRAGWEGAAIVKEVRTLAKVEGKQSAKAWLGSMRVGL